MYLFANKEPRDRLNRSKLKELQGVNNPVAFIKSHTIANKTGKKMANISHYDNESIIPATLICIGAKVAIT